MRLIIFLFLLNLILCISYSQDVEEYLNSQESDLPFQKLYLHTDREFYFENDTLWFCAYHVHGQTHIKEEAYANLYVEIVNSQGDIVLEEMHIIGHGIGSGYIPLDESKTPEGVYLLRAYTRYLEEFGDKAIFSKTINISSVKNSIELKADKESRSTNQIANQNIHEVSDLEIDIDFLPEGGYLLAQENNCVAFKAINSSGKPVEIKGELIYGIKPQSRTLNPCFRSRTPRNSTKLLVRRSEREGGLNERKTKVLDFESLYKGTGRFDFIPEAGETYYAKVDGVSQLIPLPEVKANGAKIKVVNQSLNLLNLVIQERNLNNSPYMFLACIHRGNGMFYVKVEQQQFNRILEIELEKFGCGINRLVLLDNLLNPISERLIFIGKDDIKQLDVGINKQVFERRELVKLDIVSTLSSEDSLRHVSMAVVDENYVNARGATQNMASYLLLESELNGQISSPADYFRDSEKIKSPLKLDLLMLTNGWSNYLWNTINSNPPDIPYGPDWGLNFTGRVKRLLSKKPVKEGEVSLILYNSDTTSTFHNTEIDGNGNFTFNHIVPVDSVTIVVQARNKRNNNNLRFEINIPEHHPPPVSQSSLFALENYSEIPFSTYRQRYLEYMKLKEFYPDKFSLKIPEVEIKEKYPGPRIKTGDVRKNDGPYKLESKETQGYMDIISYIAYKVPGIFIRYDEFGQMMVSVRANLPPAAIIIDQTMPITQADARNYSPEIFESIEIRTPPMSYYLGSRSGGLNGAILLNTKKDFRPEPKNPDLLGGIVKRIKGFSNFQEFYSPKYTTDNIDLEAPDYRQTLYWNPLIFLKDGYGQATFFTADNLGRYKVFIEGISENGKVCLGYAEFEVNE